jgi:DNA recombination protein RmuC
MAAALSIVVGLVLGVAGTWAYALKRSQALADKVSAAQSELRVRDSQLADAHARLERQSADHSMALDQMGQTFKNLSTDVLHETVVRFNTSQEDIVKLRDEKLDSTLRPLEELLGEYKKNLAEFNLQNAGALSDVKSKAAELLDAQQKTQQETRRLNQLLGRSSQRGAWGEIQLANVMQASGLRQSIDYELQVSASNDEGRSMRPDCVINLPNGIRLAVDAKFPFAAFEASLDAEDGDARRDLQAKHASALRSHVKALKDKSYWEVVSPAPEYVVCFMPSDVALSAALDADPELLSFAADERVVIVGPTNLLSLLWSVGFIVRQHQIAVNAEQIYDIANKMFDRIRLVAEPVGRMGKSVDSLVRDYNAMLSSIESRLIPAANQMRSLGGAQRAKDLPELNPVDQLTNQLNESKWGAQENVLFEGAGEILELDALEDE